MSETNERLRQYTSNRFSLAPGNSYIEIIDSDTVAVDGCQGVLVCSQTQIRLSLARRAVCISGDELFISKMLGQSVCICGRICSVEFI